MCRDILLSFLLSVLCLPEIGGGAVLLQKQKCVCLLCGVTLLHPNKDRKLRNPSPAPPPCRYLCFSRSSPLFTVFTHQPHLSQKPFKLLEVESRSAVGGAAAGSLPKPEQGVQHLRDTGVWSILITAKHTDMEDKARQINETAIMTHIFEFAVAVRVPDDREVC